LSDQATDIIRPSGPSETGRRIVNVRERSPERIVPDETSVGVVSWHLKKYEFATQFCANKVVLDAGCGVGYGGFWLSKVAASVTGVDLSAEAIGYASRRYGNPKSQFMMADLAALPVPSKSFDVVCAFEVIEHVPDAAKVLREIQRVLRDDGVLVVSTPQVKRTTTRPQNPHHQIEYSLADFRALLSPFFAQADVLGQRRVQSNIHYYLQKMDVLKLRTWAVPRILRRKAGRLLHTTPTEDLGLDDLEVTQVGLSRATELVAVCSLPVRP